MKEEGPLGKPLRLAILRDITEREKAEGELIRLSTAVKISTDSIVISDTDAKIIDVNATTLKMYGSDDKEDLIGKNSFDLIAPEDRERALAGMKEVLEKGYVKSREYNIVTKDGTKIPVDMSVVLMQDADGKPIGFVGISRDITERKKIEEALKGSEERYRSLVELAPDGIMTFDMKGVITSCNTASTRLSGYSRDELVGRHFSKIGVLRARDIPQYLRMLNSVRRGEAPKPFEVIWRHKSGSPRFADVRVSLIREGGKTTGLQAVMRDVTERKQMEEELRRYSEHLEELVQERTRDLEEAQKRLLEAERMAAIGETASMVGHDLRNPLQAITNAVYLLKESAKTADSISMRYKEILDSLPEPVRAKISEDMTKLVEQRVEMIRIIDDSVYYANKIVSDLQDYARPLKPELVETSLRQLFNDTLSTINVPETIHVSLVVEKDLPKLMVDPALMKRVFVNLVTNALQAMPDGGKLRIRASKTGGAASISIEDTGVGIPEENLPKIFQPLFTTKSKGMGFGLPVCKRIVEAHNGSITVESKVGVGSTFTVRIPLTGR